MTWEFHKPIGSLTKDRRSAALVYVGMILTVLIGGGLAVDAGRLFDLQTSLLEGADALAFVGAAELNRRPQFGDAPSSIDRATNAFNNLVQNQSQFGTSRRTKFTVSNVRFLSGLPASNHYEITVDYETTIPAEAHSVEVTVTPVTMNIIFPVGGASNQAIMSAVAVGGLDVAACQFAALYICNPYERLPKTVYDAAANPNSRQLEVILKKQGGATAQNRPGNYRQRGVEEV